MAEDKKDLDSTETVNLGQQRAGSPSIETVETDPLMIRDTDTTKLKRVSPSTQNINLDGESVYSLRSSESYQRTKKTTIWYLDGKSNY